MGCQVDRNRGLAGCCGSRFRCRVTTHGQRIGSSQHLNPHPSPCLPRTQPLSASAATTQNAPPPESCCHCPPVASVLQVWRAMDSNALVLVPAQRQVRVGGAGTAGKAGDRLQAGQGEGRGLKAGQGDGTVLDGLLPFCLMPRCHACALPVVRSSSTTHQVQPGGRGPQV